MPQGIKRIRDIPCNLEELRALVREEMRGSAIGVFGLDYVDHDQERIPLLNQKDWDNAIEWCKSENGNKLRLLVSPETTSQEISPYKIE